MSKSGTEPKWYLPNTGLFQGFKIKLITEHKGLLYRQKTNQSTKQKTKPKEQKTKKFKKPQKIQKNQTEAAEADA